LIGRAANVGATGLQLAMWIAKMARQLPALAGLRCGAGCPLAACCTDSGLGFG